MINQISVDAGDLNKKITIVTITNIISDDGFNQESQVVYYSPFAKVSNMSGSQIFKAGALFDKSITTFIVRFRYDKIVTDNMRIIYKNDLYQIIDVNNYSESNQFVEITGQVILNG
jgi:SPP1 family predicted phage head-tail adaptor